MLREDHKWSSYPKCTCQDATFDVRTGANQLSDYYSWLAWVVGQLVSIGVYDIVIQRVIFHTWIFNSRWWIEDHQEDRTGGKQWNLNFEKWILKSPLYILHKGTKRHNICSILPPNRKSCKNDIVYFTTGNLVFMGDTKFLLVWLSLWQIVVPWNILMVRHGWQIFFIL